MLTYQKILGNLESIRFNLTDCHLKTKENETFIIDYLSNKFRIAGPFKKEVLEEYIKEATFSLTSAGLFIDFPEIENAIPKKYELLYTPTIEEVESLINTISSCNTLKQLLRLYLPNFQSLENIYLRYQKLHLEQLKKFYRDIEAELKRKFLSYPNSTEKEKIEKNKLGKNYYNYNPNKEAKRACFAMFKKELISDLNLYLNLRKMHNTPIPYPPFDLSILYYYITLALSLEQKVSQEYAIYAFNYLKYLKMVNPSFPLNEVTLTIDGEIKHLPLSPVIAYVKNNLPASEVAPLFEIEPTDYQALKESTIKNLQILNYQIFKKGDVKLVRKKLAEYIKYSEMEKNSTKEDSKIALLNRKSRYFSSLPYERVLQGIERYSGYWGFQVEDQIILERFMKDDKKLIIALEDAIYVIEEKDFELVAASSKQDIMALIDTGIIKAHRIYHTGNWEERVDKVLRLKRN